MIKRKRQKTLRLLLHLLWILLIFLGTLAYYSAKWYIGTFGDIGFEAVLFTILNGAQTSADSLITAYLRKALVPTLGITVLISLMLIFPNRIHIYLIIKGRKRLTLFPFREGGIAIGVILISAALLIQGASIFGLSDWLKMQTQQTTIYQDEYVFPSEENVVFEGRKRNLVYIYIESMETTFFSVAEGGALPYNVCPELYKLAKDNINFAQNEGVGGGLDTVAAGWTAGAMTAQTSGLPLKAYYAPEVDLNTVGSTYPFLPGAKTLCDILQENGYYQALMVGSDSSFGGRKQLYLQHGADKVYDLYTAREDGVISPDYYTWWGFEDLYLFSYAKQELLKIAKQGQPFAFTMLTADTHHVGGYVCDLCQEQYAERYENVYACSSRQVYEFIRWIQAQDFYEETTIIITGDHTSMDRDYMERNVSADYVRRVYNCIINPVATSENTKNREFTTMDMFPTTLSAMGATIVGNRLGLGTDLFSGAPTLLERFGLEWWETEIEKPSNYYISHFATGGE